MKQKIVFFDIDGTVFNYRLFLSNFSQKVVESFNLEANRQDQLKTIYEETKKERGYFIADVFLQKIADKFKVNIDTLTNIFWDEDSFRICFYEDITAVAQTAKSAVVGILSTGEQKFQSHKLLPFLDVVDTKNIYIFPDKVESAKAVMQKYEDFKIYMIDDLEDVASKIKERAPQVFTILIDRQKKTAKNDKIDAIVNSLSEIPTLINE